MSGTSTGLGWQQHLAARRGHQDIEASEFAIGELFTADLPQQEIVRQVQRGRWHRGDARRIITQTRAARRLRVFERRAE